MPKKRSRRKSPKRRSRRRRSRSCGTGKIWRKAYTRKTKTGKVVHVKRACIKKRGVGRGKRSAWRKRVTKRVRKRQKSAARLTR